MSERMELAGSRLLDSFDFGPRTKPENSVRREVKSSRWVRRKMIALSLILLSAGAVAAYSYFSNTLSSTTVVSNFAITLSGTVPSSGFVATETYVGFTAKSETGSALVNGVLQVDVTRAGQAGDLALKITGNPIAPSCSGNTCTYVGTIGTIGTSPSTIDTTWTWWVSGSYTIVVQVKV